MAGFTFTLEGLAYEFNVDTPDVANKVREATNGRRVVDLQLDGDELEAVLWGLENYKKGQ